VPIISPPSPSHVSAEPFLKGSTLGSLKDLKDATEFMAEKKLVPVISHTVDGLESVEKGFEILEKGEQFGKVVLKIRPPLASRL